MIKKYSFGHIVIDDKEYTSDLKIFPDGKIQDQWWRKEGHQLNLEDITDLIESKPEVLVVGTGASGMMQVSPQVETELQQKGIAIKTAFSGDAIQLYNEIFTEKKTALCIHITC